MTTATPLYDQALARSKDPYTSHAATAAAHQSTARDDVFKILTAHGPLHDRGIEALHDAYVAKGLMPKRSGQRLRTARRELADEMRVRECMENGDVLRVRMPSGYSSIVWEVTR